MSAEPISKCKKRRKIRIESRRNVEMERGLRACCATQPCGHGAAGVKHYVTGIMLT